MPDFDKFENLSNASIEFSTRNHKVIEHIANARGRDAYNEAYTTQLETLMQECDISKQKYLEALDIFLGKK